MTANQILQASGAFLPYLESLNLPAPAVQVGALNDIYSRGFEKYFTGTDELCDLIRFLETWTWPGSNPPALLAPADKITVLQCVAWLYGAATA